MINVDWSFRNYKYKEWTGKTSEERDLSEMVSEIGKDYMDLIRYGEVVPWSWIPPEPIPELAEGDYKSSRKRVERPVGSDGV